MPSETTLRLGIFLAMLIIMGLAETALPRRPLSGPRLHRWVSNLSISTLSTLAARLLIPAVPTAVALWCADNGYGLLNLVNFPTWLSFIIAVLALDMVIYWQHVLFHKNTLLWRIHRMHHADTDIDASTGIRFHPIEILISVIIKLCAVLVLGPPVAAVIVFEILLNGCALFNHANVRLPIQLDAWLRLLVVTPDMHRIHHSTDMREANRNFGFNFPWWDRVYGTYTAQPSLGHNEMRIGLNIFRDAAFVRLDKMLLIPFL